GGGGASVVTAGSGEGFTDGWGFPKGEAIGPPPSSPNTTGASTGTASPDAFGSVSAERGAISGSARGGSDGRRSTSEASGSRSRSNTGAASCCGARGGGRKLSSTEDENSSARASGTSGVSGPERLTSVGPLWGAAARLMTVGALIGELSADAML